MSNSEHLIEISFTFFSVSYVDLDAIFYSILYSFSAMANRYAARRYPVDIIH